MPHTEHGHVAPRNGAPVGWRRDRLVDAGFPRGQAILLARDARYDLHALIELVERGCPPSLAVRILAPVDLETDAA
jgi:hypothetical protein